MLGCGSNSATPITPSVPPASTPPETTEPKPEPAPEPTPDLAKPPPPPADVTKLDTPEILVSSQGSDYVEWSWNPVDYASSYHIWFFTSEEMILDDDPKVIGLDGSQLSFREEDIDPGTELYVRIRAAFRFSHDSDWITSDWSDRIYAKTDSLPRSCTDERRRALRYGRSNGVTPLLVKSWSGKPFKFYWDSSIPESESHKIDELTGVFHRMAEMIEDQLGYPILEFGGWTDPTGLRFNRDNIVCSSDGAVSPVGIVATIHPNDLYYEAAARPHCGVIFWTGGDIDYENVKVLPHEIFHLFGYAHSPFMPFQIQAPPGEGVHMSYALSGPVVYSERLNMTFEDIDALKCIFPK